MSLLINLIPVVVILWLLFRRHHMLVAGVAGGVIAVIIGRLSFDQISELFVDGIANMLGITVPILYASAAMMVSRAGSIGALVELSRRGLKGNLSILAGIIVLIQGLATYTAGMGAGNTMVTAPLMAAAVGLIPGVIGAMTFISAIGFTTSPASTETVLASESAGRDVVEHANAMLPYTIAFYLLAVVFAIYSVYRKGKLINGGDVGEESEESNLTLLKQATPFIALLIMVVASGNLNALLGFNLFSPSTAVIFTGVLTVLLTPLNGNKASEALVDGSKFILTTLFSVGIFLAFINMIGELGTFEQIAALARKAPEAIILPVAMVIAFLIAIPSGAFTAGVLTLTLPTLSALGLPSEAMGFVAIATGLGTQISPVQINVAAMADGFDTDILDIIQKNMKYIIGALVLVTIVAVIVV